MIQSLVLENCNNITYVTNKEVECHHQAMPHGNMKSHYR